MQKSLKDVDFFCFWMNALLYKVCKRRDKNPAFEGQIIFAEKIASTISLSINLGKTVMNEDCNSLELLSVF